jgi:hypothetical protein
MSTVARVSHWEQLSGEPGLSFPATSYDLSAPDAEDSRAQVCWRVEVSPDGHLITRQVLRDEQPWHQCHREWEPERVIWPTWPARSKDEIEASGSPLAGVQEYWSTVGNRLRDSAKWMAAVLGAALAAVIGTSPLTGMREHKPQGIAIMLGAAGLIFLGITIFLVMQVMRPQSVSYTDVQRARGRRWPWQEPLYKWRLAIESDRDLYLPCGVRCLTGLRESMIIEEMTLVALSRATATARDQMSSQVLCEARTARAARLLELRVAAARIATVGEYYKLRHRSSWATYAGVLCGLAGTAAIVAAFAWPLS